MRHSLPAQHGLDLIRKGPVSAFWPLHWSPEGADDLLWLIYNQASGIMPTSEPSPAPPHGDIAPAAAHFQAPANHHSVDIKSIHKPSQFGDEIQNTPVSELRAHIAIVFAYMDRVGADFHSTIVFWFTMKHVAWIHNLLRSCPGLTRDDFTQELVRYCTGQVRSESVLALESLIKDQITQGSSSTAEYAQRFLNVVRLLPDESQASLCHYYVKGLTPALRSRTCLTRDNQEWADLNSCMQYSYSEEYKMSFETNLTHNDDDDEGYNSDYDHDDADYEEL